MYTYMYMYVNTDYIVLCSLLLCPPLSSHWSNYFRFHWRRDRACEARTRNPIDLYETDTFDIDISHNCHTNCTKAVFYVINLLVKF